ncbi:hypothetical protein ACIBG4_08835 [Nonomuraea sp. NPDC050383]|uniref:hypothetical protein n=1 Tax=Nonomuraea sp. NPDC050383 TaxID=3364362 RepID=UPI0037AE7405
MEWAPAECTLPTEERPLRVAEFDELFAAALRGLERIGPTHLRLALDGGAQVEETTRGLTARETSCCSFFTFSLTTGSRTADGARLVLDVKVPSAHAGVLDGLQARALRSAPWVSQ